LRTKFLTAIFCLIALFAELTLDSSTAFVREQPHPSVGHLVIEKYSGPDRTPSVPDLPATDSGSDLLKFAGGSAHAGQVAAPLALHVFLPVSRFSPEPDTLSLEPLLSELQRPPSA
jgi:hypothetical protein